MVANKLWNDYRSLQIIFMNDTAVEPMSSDNINSGHTEFKLYAVLPPECFVGFICCLSSKLHEGFEKSGIYVGLRIQ